MPEPEHFHPLTTHAAPLLASRGVSGAPADVWEEVDRAAAWVAERWSAPAGGRSGSAHEAASGARSSTPRADAAARRSHEVRQALRVLCVALRLAIDAPGPVRPPELPWSVSLGDLLRALRCRLLEQQLAAQRSHEPSADPSALIAVLAACERLEEGARGDATRLVVEQLSGARALELLVEVAHDMRSPLGSILFLVEQVRSGQSGPLTPAQDRQLGLVYGAGFSLSSMVGDVMELARGGARLATGEPGPFALASVVEAVCAIVRPIAEEKGLALEVHAPPMDARVGHAAGIHRVLLNLVTNALKFTPAGRVTVHVEPLAGDRVGFRVADTGRGIPPEVLAQLFHTFRPRAEDREIAFSSAGLGLAICRKLVEAMGGELTVESEEGAGTRFAFSLELPRAPHLPEARARDGGRSGVAPGSRAR